MRRATTQRMLIAAAVFALSLLPAAAAGPVQPAKESFSPVPQRPLTASCGAGQVFALDRWGTLDGGTLRCQGAPDNPCGPQGN
jgi:hypothetical protein